MSEQPRRRRRQQMPSEEPVMPIGEAAESVASNVGIIAPSIPHSFSYDTAIPNTRTKTGLLEYIKTAIELETDLATQERIVAECQADIQRRKPTLKLINLPPKPSFEKDEYELAAVLSYGGAILIAVLLLLPGYIPFWVIALYSGPFAIAGWFCSKASKKIVDKNKKLQEVYEQNYEKVVEQNKIAQNAYDSAIYECDTSCKIIVEEARPHIDETRSILSRLYSLGVIYPKYCNLPALTSIYEYYMTGRCEELTGPHGAYNLYEDELRKDTVISQLNTVIENLEQIRHSQYMLYEQVCAIQQNTAAIRSELAQIKGYTIQIAELAKLNAYYAARTEANTRITMYYHL